MLTRDKNDGAVAKLSHTHLLPVTCGLPVISAHRLTDGKRLLLACEWYNTHTHSESADTRDDVVGGWHSTNILNRNGNSEYMVY